MPFSDLHAIQRKLHSKVYRQAFSAAPCQYSVVEQKKIRQIQIVIQKCHAHYVQCKLLIFLNQMCLKIKVSGSDYKRAFQNNLKFLKSIVQGIPLKLTEVAFIQMVIEPSGLMKFRIAKKKVLSAGIISKGFNQLLRRGFLPNIRMKKADFIYCNLDKLESNFYFLVFPKGNRNWKLEIGNLGHGLIKLSELADNNQKITLSVLMKQLPQMKSSSYVIHVKLDERQKIDYSNQNKKSKIIIPIIKQN